MNRETAEQWHARVTSEDGIIAALKHMDAGIPDSPARRKLKRKGLIESYRNPMITQHRHSYWRLTAKFFAEAAP